MPSPVKTVLVSDGHYLVETAKFALGRSGSAQWVPLDIHVECSAESVIAEHSLAPAHESRTEGTVPCVQEIKQAELLEFHEEEPDRISSESVELHLPVMGCSCDAEQLWYLDDTEVLSGP